jgi:hypothetical protein
MPKNRYRVLLAVFLAGSSLLLALVVLGDWAPWLRGPAPGTSEWYWPYLLRPVYRWWAPILAGAFLWLVATYWISRRQACGGQTAAALLLLFVASFMLQIALIYADRADSAAELVDRTLSNQASGFFEAAAEIDRLAEVLANYPQQMPLFTSEHARTHPPGLITANWATIQLLGWSGNLADTWARIIWPLRCTDLWLLNRPPEVAAALGLWAVLPLIFAAATFFPAYLVSGSLLSGYTKRLATVLAGTLPALLLFAPKSVQLYAPLSLFLFWAIESGLRHRSAGRLLLAGILLSVLTFLSLGNAVLLLLLALYAGISVLIKESAQRDGAIFLSERATWFKLVTVFAVGAASIWVLYWAVWGVPPWSIISTGLDQHYSLVTNLRRYEWWVGWNLVDLVTFAGWPLVLGFGGACFLAVRRWRKDRLSGVDALAAALLIFMLLLNFSGTARGEVGRLWLFFMPLLAFPAASFWRAALPGWRFGAAIVALQLLLALCLGFAWRPVRAVIVVAERPPVVTGTADEVLNIHFQDEPLTLQGYSLEEPTIPAGEAIDLTLYWTANGSTARPYTVFNHLLDDNGALLAQQDNWPVNGTWPPTCWRGGEQVVDSYHIPVPPELAPGQYRLVTGLYDARNGERLRSAGGREAIELQRIEVTSP